MAVMAKVVIKLKNKSYIDRLIYPNLPTLKYRRLRGDMIEVFKITNNIYDRTVSPDLPLNERANTTINCKITADLTGTGNRSEEVIK